MKRSQRGRKEATRKRKSYHSELNKSEKRPRQSVKKSFIEAMSDANSNNEATQRPVMISLL
jgi:hypothetical protein